MKDKKEHLPLGNVQLYIFEELTQQGRNLKLHFRTEMKYPCSNHIIRFQNNSAWDTFDVKLIDVESQTLCMVDNEPACTWIDLGFLETGIFPVKITINDVMNTGTLQIKTEKYVVNIQNSQLLKVMYDTLLRIPDYTIWGLVAYNDTTGISATALFLDSLQSIGALPATLAEGNFGYFETDSNGKIIIPENVGWNFTQSFTYQYFDEWDKINEIVWYFTFTYPRELFIYIYNYQGQTYLSSYYY